MSKKYLMVLDAGSGGGKCLVFDTDGNQASASFEPWHRARWNPEIGWRCLVSATRKALSHPDVSPEQIVAISSTSMREEFVLVDSEEKEYFIPFGEPVFSEGTIIEEKFGEEMYRSSGHWPTAFMPAPKLVWFKKNHPKEFERLKCLLMISDWILYKLCEEPTVEPSGVCETCLFDLEKSDWSNYLISKVGLPREIFPKVRENGSLLGSVTARTAEETSLLEGTPVVVGGADTQCGLIGSACVRDKQTTAVAGTTTPVQMVLPKPVIDEKLRLWSNCHAVPGKWILESNAGATGWLYRWVRDALGDLEVAASRVTGIDAYDLLNSAVEIAPPGSNGVLAYLGAGIMNVSRTTLRPTCILGLKTFSRQGFSRKNEIVRAVMESTCFAVRANCEQLEEVSGNTIPELIFCGGASRSRLWTQIQSDVLNRPIKIPFSKEATALGAAILAGVGIKIYDNVVDAAERIVKWEQRVEPRQNIASDYEKYYQRWVHGYHKLQDLTELATPF